jgi:hypothetical protein
VIKKAVLIFGSLVMFSAVIGCGNQPAATNKPVGMGSSEKMVSPEAASARSGMAKHQLPKLPDRPKPTS